MLNLYLICDGFVKYDGIMSLEGLESCLGCLCSNKLKPNLRVSTLQFHVPCKGAQVVKPFMNHT